MNPILEQISNIGIVPVIAIDDAKKAVPLAKALVAGGLPVAEVTFRTAAAEEAMRSITREVPEMLVGAGTVLNREQVDRALDAGAKFIVSPGFNPDTVRYVLSKGALMVPGTATPGEMEQAMSLGLDVVKFFPAEQNGGVAKLKAIAGPYKTLKWMPTGGVNAKNLMDYLSFDQIVACGGTWMVKKDLIAAENWDEITRMTREAVRTMWASTAAARRRRTGWPGRCAPFSALRIRWATPPYRPCLRWSAPRLPAPAPTVISPSAPTAWTGRSITWAFRASGAGRRPARPTPGARRRPSMWTARSAGLPFIWCRRKAGRETVLIV